MARILTPPFESWLWCLCVLCTLCVLRGSSHELERTQVALSFSRDGSFVLDVSNDASWLRDRMHSIPGPFADRIVLWVDGHEIRPESVEEIRGDGLTTNRLRGHMPPDAKSLRWYYGLVGDPYPLTIHRADGKIIVEEVQGDAWSRPIDLSGQFHEEDRWPIVVVIVLSIVGGYLRLRGRIPVKDTKDTKDTKGAAVRRQP